jgi:hypothetical protein
MGVEATSADHHHVRVGVGGQQLRSNAQPLDDGRPAFSRGELVSRCRTAGDGGEVVHRLHRALEGVTSDAGQVRATVAHR